MSKAGYVYFMRGSGNLVKIGVTDNLNRRVNEISPKLPFEIKIIHSFYSEDVYAAERNVHEVFKHYRARGEWFELSSDEFIGIESGFYDDFDVWRRMMGEA